MGRRHDRSVLMQRLELEAELAPGRYRLKLALLALLGYAVLLLALAATVGVVLFLLVYMLVAGPPDDPHIAVPIIVLGLLGAVVVRALWIRFEAPPGHRLEPGQAPRLQAEIERVRQAVGARPLHGIVIDAELNAAAAYLPSGFGPWGHRHYLVLGLPLLEVLDSDELAAVLAHEFGHFHAGHGHFTSWIYRLRVAWHRLAEGLSGPGAFGGGLLLWLFFRWYAPYFNAYSQVLARRQEYAADAMAVQVAGGGAAARALVRIEVASDWLQGEFWPRIHAAARLQAYPPVQVYAAMASGLRDELPRRPVPRWLLARAPDLDDSHPTLGRRLAAIGIDPAAAGAEPGAEPAIELLDDLAERLQDRFGRDWHTAAQEQWRQSHHDFEAARQRLAELEAHPTLAAAEQVEWACLVRQHRPGTDPLPRLQQATQLAPSSAAAHFHLAAALLERDRVDESLALLERAIALDASLAGPALQQLDRHARRSEEAVKPGSAIDTLRSKVLELEIQAIDADEEAADAPQPHGLDDAQLGALARTLGTFEKVRQAWVIIGQTQGASVTPHYLVLLDWTGSTASERATRPRISGQLQLPGSVTLVDPGAQRKLAQRIRQAGAAAYRRPR